MKGPEEMKKTRHIYTYKKAIHRHWHHKPYMQKYKKIRTRISRTITSIISAIFVGIIILWGLLTAGSYVSSLSGITVPVHSLNIEGGDGLRITLFNNMSAKDPTYDELITFIRNDKTDEIGYNPDSFVCADYAKTVHDNAEKVGIRAAFVSISFSNNQDGHACNAFNTTDKGLVFVDCTSPYPYPIGNNDAIATLEEGHIYKIKGLFGSSNYFDNLVVSNYDIYW